MNKLIASSILFLGLAFSTPAYAQSDADDLYRESALYQHANYVEDATLLFCNSLKDGRSRKDAFNYASYYYFSRTADLLGVSTKQLLNSLTEDTIVTYIEVLGSSTREECPQYFE